MREVLEVRGDGVTFTLENHSGWTSRDLAKFFARGLRAYKVRSHRYIIVTPSPIRSRGCAQIGKGKREGAAISIAIASPSRFDLRRLARLFEHEVAHTKGQYHEDMPHNVLWSLGPVPAWAKVPLRWRGPSKAPKRSLSRKRPRPHGRLRTENDPMSRRRSSSMSYGRDASNPQKGEVFESKWGNRWMVTGRGPKGHVLVKRAGNRFDGELQWTPTMLSKLKMVRGEESRAVSKAIEPELKDLKFKSGASLMDRVFGRAKPPEETQMSLFRDPRGRAKRLYTVKVYEVIARGKRVFYMGKRPSVRGKIVLRRDLTKKINPLYSRKAVLRAEKTIARTLRRRGLSVKGART